MKSRLLTVLAVAPTASLVFLVPASTAAVPTCHGMDATIVGTDSSETLTGTEGTDVVVMGGGNDVFNGKGGDDVICGGAGKDSITPGPGNDIVHGGDGVDKIFEGPGDDRLDGGPGIDMLSYSASGTTNTAAGATDLHLDARTGVATSSNGTDAFSSFGWYVGSPNSDLLIGSSSDDRINGYAGPRDVIHGLDGDDDIYVEYGAPKIYAGNGDDVVHTDRVHDTLIVLGNGNDKMLFLRTGSGGRWVGGPGVDLLQASGLSLVINMNQGFIQTKSTGGRWGIDGFENARGTYGPDRIVGNGVANRLDGAGGLDTILGLGGDDVLLAGDTYYSNVLDGGAGNDRCGTISVLYPC